MIVDNTILIKIPDKIFDQVETSSKIGQEKTSLVSTFACFSTPIAWKGGRLAAGLWHHQNLSFFQYFLIS